MPGRHAATRALIVGGTQGLGLAIAERLIAEGCTRLVLASRDVEIGEREAARLGVPFLHVEMGDPAVPHRMVDAAVEALGGLDALVNAAAQSDRGSILDSSPELFDRLMAVNARGPFLALQRFAQHAVQADCPAAAVNILSMVIHGGQSFIGPYSASKAALANITRNAAQTLRRHRIRVNGIACGWMDTPGEDAVQRRFHGAGDEWLAEAEARQPMGSLVKTPHVAALAAYLLSAESGVMTGSVIDFDQHVAGAYPE